MKVWSIPVVYEGSGMIDVKANTLVEAIQKVGRFTSDDVYRKDEATLISSPNYEDEEIREFFNGGEYDDE